uniref:Uncharacterized protein n=1 Tax=Romanomermis culicivorax TaxID=13658 RepID=A0A915L950_ROMCU
MNSSDENGTHENFLRDVLEPFVKTYFPTSVHMPHSCEIERLDDVINNYDVNAGRFMTDDDLKWLKKCVDSYKPPMIVRNMITE